MCGRDNGSRKEGERKKCNGMKLVKQREVTKVMDDRAVKGEKEKCLDEKIRENRKKRTNKNQGCFFLVRNDKYCSTVPGSCQTPTCGCPNRNKKETSKIITCNGEKEKKRKKKKSFLCLL